jgi:hypothetical protein
MTVAIAAPLTSSTGNPNRPKIIIGSKIIFVTAPAISETMLQKVSPTACKKRWNIVLTRLPTQKIMQIDQY